MGFRFKSDSDKWAAINALKVAAERYKADADVVKLIPALWKQFEHQAQVATRLAAEIEDAADA